MKKLDWWGAANWVGSELNSHQSPKHLWGVVISYTTKYKNNLNN
jgi:hypothetical protein